MHAVVTRPAERGRVEMIELERPTLGRDEVLIAMRDVGVDGTDHEVVKGTRGDKPPAGDDYLILNGVLCLLSITGASEPMTLDVAALNQRLVLGNGVIFGSVNSSRAHFERAISDLAAFEERWPGVAGRLITRRVPFERYEEAFAEREGDVKVLIEVSRAE